MPKMPPRPRLLQEWNHHTEVNLPVASVGVCRNARRCKQYCADLANGLCVICWDRPMAGDYRTRRS